MTTQFWTNEPTILFNKEYMLELWPSANMNYEQKLNAITRLIILISILGYILTMSTRIIFVGIATLVIIFVLFKTKKQKLTKEMLDEGFTVQGNEVTGLFEKKINNYTQIANEFLDQMHKYTGETVKVFLAISRKTIGWHKLSDRISYSQLLASMSQSLGLL